MIQSIVLLEGEPSFCSEVVNTLKIPQQHDGDTGQDGLTQVMSKANLDHNV